ncbi:hypothetical protein OEZ85_004670 [Tetradesmus obliquus]|uniref:Uncharacterized protein n=1 Tax=Tetradesmus obliquus TaxID=3088 RepID=A0ABY8ULM5_TETOB|nr:hypothetical protein OEZ85_004670 [Tetradesmus obliquus]
MRTCSVNKDAQLQKLGEQSDWDDIEISSCSYVPQQYKRVQVHHVSAPTGCLSAQSAAAPLSGRQCVSDWQQVQCAPQQVTIDLIN